MKLEAEALRQASTYVLFCWKAPDDFEGGLQMAQQAVAGRAEAEQEAHSAR